MTTPIKERYLSDTEPDLISRLLAATSGNTGVTILEYVAVVTTIITIPGIVLAFMTLISGSYFIATVYVCALVGSLLSVFLVQDESPMGWFLLAPILSLYCAVFFLLTCIVGVLFLPLFLLYLAALVHAVRWSILRLYAIRPFIAGLLIILPCMVVVIAAMFLPQSLSRID